MPPALALLQTCRQIHTEAALIPFTTIDFIVDCDAFTTFMASLLKVQKAAIKRLTLVMQGGRSTINGDTFTQGQLAIKDLHDLAEVEHLTLIISGAVQSMDRFESLEKLACLPLKTVEVVLDKLSTFEAFAAPGGRHQILVVDSSYWDFDCLQEAADALKTRLLRS